MPAGIARSKVCGGSATRASYSCGLAVFVGLFGCWGLQNAIAGGDTPIPPMHDTHISDGGGAAAAPAQPADNALLAALEREATRRRLAAETAATASSSAAGASYRLASYPEPSPNASQTPSGLPPSRIISTRGLWDSATADQPAPGASATPAVETQAQPSHPPAETTIAVKRGPDQAVSTVIAAHPGPAATAGEGTRFDNPWLDAVMISPSVRRYLTVLTLGAEDYRSFAALVEQPVRSVMMTFGAEPTPGMTNDRFSGSAIVFVSTVTYQPPPDHTASLN